MKMLGEILAQTASTKGCQPAAQQQAADWKQARAAPVRPPTRARPVLDSRGCAPRSEERRVGKECRSGDWSSDVCSSDLSQQRNSKRRTGSKREQPQCAPPPERALYWTVEAAHPSVEPHSNARKLHDFGRRFMATFRKTETGKQNQQRAIGNRPAIITRRGFAANRKLGASNRGRPPTQNRCGTHKGAAKTEEERGGSARGVRGSQ